MRIINFFEYDAEIIYEDGKTKLNELLGEEVPEASKLDITLRTISYMLSQSLASANDSAKQNYLRFARGERLDLKGELYGERGKRLEATPASVVMNCSVKEVSESDIIIPTGTRFKKDQYIFKTEVDNFIEKGNISVDIKAICSDIGVPEYDAGEVTNVLDPWDNYDKCHNIEAVTTSNEMMSDQKYRELLKLLPESFSTAGPKRAYEFYAKKATVNVRSVVAHSPNPCEIKIYCLGPSGADLSKADQRKVLETLSQKDIVPLGDKIEVVNPERMEYEIDFSYYLSSENTLRYAEVDRLIREDIENYIKNKNEVLGADVNPQDIIYICKKNGAKRVKLNSPKEYKETLFNVVAIPKLVNIEYGGIDDSEVVV